jgi:pimeloyl-ACP methyl ester carboxylesterase
MTITTVFVPGLLCSAEVFAHQAAALWGFGPVMVASTLEGNTVAQVAAAILRDAPPRFALAGISWGGYVCMEMVRQAPGRVIGLALLDTSARPDTPEQSARRRAMLGQAEESKFPAWAEAALGSIAHPSRQADPMLQAINRRMGIAVGLQGFARQTEAAISRPDSRPGLAVIDVPTLVLVGEDDLLTPPEFSEEIASIISGSVLVVVANCGHASTLEQPEQVTEALLAWMRAIVVRSNVLLC